MKKYFILANKILASRWVRAVLAAQGELHNIRQVNVNVMIMSCLVSPVLCKSLSHMERKAVTHKWLQK